MANIISGLRWFIAFLLGIIFSVLIVVALLLTTVSSLVIDSQNIKTWTKTTGVYDHVLEVAVAALNSQSDSEYFQDLHSRLTTPGSELKTVAEKVLTPAKVEQAINAVVDGAYAWAGGATSNPAFDIELLTDRTTFIEFISVMFKEKLRGQPECPADFVVTPEYDPLSAECVPVGYDYNLVNQYIQDNIGDPRFEQFFQQATSGISTFTVDPQLTNYVQIGYKVLQWMPVLVFGVVLLWALMLWVLIPGRKLGMMIVSGVVAATALIVGASGLITMQLYEDVYTRALQNELPQGILLVLPYMQRGMRAVYDSFTGRLVLFSLLLFIIGAVMFVIGFLRWRYKQPPIHTTLRPTINNLGVK